MRVEASAVISVPVERVWEAIARWEDQPRWLQDADAVHVVSEAREGVGVRIAVKTRVLNVPLFTEVLEVVTWEPPRRLQMAHRSFVRGLGTWALEPEGDRARFTWTEELGLSIPVVGELALLVYRPFMRRLMRGGLAGLQAFVVST